MNQVAIISAQMYQTKSFDTEHKDVIHDIAFDYYGKRMATCSSDQVVKVRMSANVSTLVNVFT